MWSERELPPGTDELARRLCDAALRVHREVGVGFRENVYRRCLAHALREEGLQVAEHVTLAVRFGSLVLPRAGEADIIVENCVVVEVKAREALHPAHGAQVIGYLRATGLPLGLLFNFHAPVLLRGGYARYVHPAFLQRS